MNTSNDELFTQVLLTDLADIIVGEGYASFCKDWFEEHNYRLKGCHDAWVATCVKNDEDPDHIKTSEALLQHAKDRNSEIRQLLQEITGDKNDVLDEELEYRKGYEHGIREAEEIRKTRASKRYQGYKAGLEDARKRKEEEEKNPQK
jgi:hypothetical protein